MTTLVSLSGMLYVPVTFEHYVW